MLKKGNGYWSKWCISTCTIFFFFFFFLRHIRCISSSSLQVFENIVIWDKFVPGIIVILIFKVVMMIKPNAGQTHKMSVKIHRCMESLYDKCIHQQIPKTSHRIPHFSILRIVSSRRLKLFTNCRRASSLWPTFLYRSSMAWMIWSLNRLVWASSSLRGVTFFWL